MKNSEKLKNLLLNEIIPDLEDAIDELFEKIDKSKTASNEDKEELKDFQNMLSECQEILNDIEDDEMSEEEAKEILDELIDMKTQEQYPKFYPPKITLS